MYTNIQSTSPIPFQLNTTPDLSLYIFDNTTICAGK